VIIARHDMAVHYVLNNNHTHNLILLLYVNVIRSRHDMAVHYVLNNNHSHNLILLLYGNVTRSRHDMALSWQERVTFLYNSRIRLCE
jgi:hypothetical protein